MDYIISEGREEPEMAETTITLRERFGYQRVVFEGTAPEVREAIQDMAAGGVNINPALLDLSLKDLYGLDLSRETIGTPVMIESGFFKGSSFICANLNGALLPNGDFQRCNFKMAFMRSTGLEFADLQQANLTRTQAQWSQFFKANLSGVCAKKCDFSYASMQHVNLSGADCSGATFMRTDLRGADLTNTDLRGADLSGTRLNGAKFDGAKLVGAKLEGVVADDATRKALLDAQSKQQATPERQPTDAPVTKQMVR